MIELGATGTSYEPYTNGASPNPDYPQEVVNVTGRQEVKCVGKNLIGLDTQQYKVNLSAGDKITLRNTSGTSSNTYSSLTNQITQNIPIGTYTFSIQETYSKRIGFIVTFNDNTSATYNITANQYSTTFTTLKPIISYRLYLETTNGTAYNLTIKPQLENSSIATDYEPYKEETNEINLGKNLFNWNNPTTVTQIKSSNRTTAQYPVSSLVLEKGTYTISFPDLVLSNNNYPLSIELVGVVGGGYLTNNSRTFTITEKKTLSYLKYLIENYLK